MALRRFEVHTTKYKHGVDVSYGFLHDPGRDPAQVRYPLRSKRLREALARLVAEVKIHRDVVRDARIDGVHLEVQFLSPDPSAGELVQLVNEELNADEFIWEKVVYVATIADHVPH